MGTLSRLLRSSQTIRLGPLEQRLLSALWRRGHGTVRELIHYDGIEQAYTTVMTTLDRLYRKQLLDRVKEPHSRGFRYTPRYSQAELERKVIVEAIHNIMGFGTTTALPLSYLVEAIGQHDTNLLDDLRRLVDEKRRAKR